MAKTPRIHTAHQTKKLFAQRLKTARERKFETASGFAKELGVEAETYRRWERGETEPGIADLNSILELTEVSADFLITGTLPPPPKPR